MLLNVLALGCLLVVGMSGAAHGVVCFLFCQSDRHHEHVLRSSTASFQCHTQNNNNNKKTITIKCKPPTRCVGLLLVSNHGCGPLLLKWCANSPANAGSHSSHMRIFKKKDERKDGQSCGSSLLTKNHEMLSEWTYRGCIGT